LGKSDTNQSWPKSYILFHSENTYSRWKICIFLKTCFVLSIVLLSIYSTFLHSKSCGVVRLLPTSPTEINCNVVTGHQQVTSTMVYWSLFSVITRGRVVELYLIKFS
jgi:hypothetical protein